MTTDTVAEMDWRRLIFLTLVADGIGHDFRRHCSTMHPADINAALIKKGYTQTKLAKELRRSQMSISHVIYGRSRSRRTATAISKITGIDIQILWGTAYTKSKQARGLA